MRTQSKGLDNNSGFVDEFTRHQRIDEYRLMLFPIVAGASERLIKGIPTLILRLRDTTTSGAGGVFLD